MTALRIAEHVFAAIGVLFVLVVAVRLPVWWCDARRLELEHQQIHRLAEHLREVGSTVEQPSGPVATPPLDPPMTLFARAR